MLAEERALKYKELAISVKVKTKNQFIYIATTRQYAQLNLFKVGGVQSETLLKSRLASYNVGKASCDKMYFSNISECHDYKHLEQRLEKIIGSHRDSKNSELYKIHYTDLVSVVKDMSSNYDKEVDMYNKDAATWCKNLIELDPVVPVPLILEGFELCPIVNGKRIAISQTVNLDDKSEDEKHQIVQSVLNTYMQSRTDEEVVLRKDFEKSLNEGGILFKKQKVWALLKEIVASDYSHIKCKY